MDGGGEFWDGDARGPIAAAVAARWDILHDASARGGIRPWQSRVLLTSTGIVAAAALAGGASSVVAGAVLALAFVVLALVRTAALVHAARTPTALPTAPETAADRTADADLPTYAVLVALYDEAAVVPGLIRALTALDYPTDRLDVVLLLEADDRATAHALTACDLPGHIRVLVVPPGTPRTKPRALCHGLPRTRGTHVVVYDAEDRPEPDQLRRAVAAFAAGTARLGCLQARLNIYNPHDSLVTALFAVEYTALFDGLVPALVAAGAPVPLGGTSNHFPRAVLEACGGWDAWNVTEDADLGMRLARHGYTVDVLASTTWEEAPRTWPAWLRQRTRWQKGWMQTLLVHTRHPAVLWRDLGGWRTAWLTIVLGGGLLAALAHPWLVLVALLAVTGGLPAAGDGVGGVIWWSGLVTFGLAAGSTVGLAVLTVHRRGFTRLWPTALLLPLLWLPVSLAAYRALWELHRRPFHWAKTAHGVCAETGGRRAITRTGRRDDHHDDGASGRRGFRTTEPCRVPATAPTPDGGRRATA